MVHYIERAGARGAAGAGWRQPASPGTPDARGVSRQAQGRSRAGGRPAWSALPAGRTSLGTRGGAESREGAGGGRHSGARAGANGGTCAGGVNFAPQNVHAFSH